MAPINQEFGIINREVALKRLNGDQDLLIKLAGFFLEDAPLLHQQLCDASKANDFESIVHRAHSLKGLAATFEAIPFQKLVAEIESLGRIRAISALDQKMELVNVEFQRLTSELLEMVHVAEQQTSVASAIHESQPTVPST